MRIMHTTVDPCRIYLRNQRAESRVVMCRLSHGTEHRERQMIGSEERCQSAGERLRGASMTGRVFRMRRSGSQRQPCRVLYRCGVAIRATGARSPGNHPPSAEPGGRLGSPGRSASSALSNLSQGAQVSKFPPNPHSHPQNDTLFRILCTHSPALPKPPKSHLSL